MMALTQPQVLELQQQKLEVQKHRAQRQPSLRSLLIVIKVGKKSGEGSFGVIYEGIHIHSQIPCAIKFEPRKSDAPQLKEEYKTYKILKGSGMLKEKIYILVLENINIRDKTY